MGMQATPIDEATFTELRTDVREAIDALPEAQRRVVRMRYFEGKTFKEIARIEGVPLNTALGRMHLAAKKLRRTLEERDDT